MRGRVLELFAEILDYPWAHPAGAAGRCEAAVAAIDPQAAAVLAEFRSEAARLPLGRLQEMYSAFFELNPACPPYVGHHLFGESYKRSAFLVGLRERCGAVGLDPGGELPDHLVVLLRFLARGSDAEENRELVGHVLLPALERMVAQREPGAEAAATEQRDLGGGALYRRALLALKLVLQQPVAVGGSSP